MSEKMPCELIQDLLPSYHDKLTSDTTNRIVETHLDECSVCSEMLRDMDTPVIAEQEADERNSPVIDFLRKARRMERWKMIVCCVMVVLVFCGAAKFIQYVSSHNVSDCVASLNITVDEDTIYVDGTMRAPLYSVKNVEIRPQVQKSKSGDYQSGYYCIIVSGAEDRKSDDGSVAEFHAEKKISHLVKGIYLDGAGSSTLVWTDGEMISPQVFNFYDDVDLFMDNPESFAEGTGNSLGLDVVAGQFTRELDDPEHPTALHITVKEVQDQDLVPEILKRAKVYAYAFLSAAEEIQQVDLTYVTAEDGASKVTFTREEANAFAGGDISAQAKTNAGRARLLRTLGVDTTRIYDWDYEYSSD